MTSPLVLAEVRSLVQDGDALVGGHAVQSSADLVMSLQQS